MNNLPVNRPTVTSNSCSTMLIAMFFCSCSAFAATTDEPVFPSVLESPMKPGFSIITLSDLPPEIRDEAISANNGYKQNGFRLVPDAEIERYSIESLKRGFTPNTTGMLAKMQKSQTDLVKPGSAHSLTIGDTYETTEFGAVNLEGVISNYPYEADSISSIIRVFQTKDRSSMLLSAIDFSSNTMAVSVPIESINSKVKGYPAILNVLKSDSHGEKFLVVLSWFTETTNYTLYKRGMGGEVDVENFKEKIISLAEKIE